MATGPADASTAWSDQADELYAAHKCLSEIDTALLGPRVGPVAKTFITRWSKRLQTLRTDAEGHATSLTDAASTWTGVDDASEDDMQALLPWEHRNLEADPSAADRAPGRP